ncbi:MarR family winged helix-turn-helix transcriptional regulator [Pseudooceanicola sp. 502str34]|uniref:MarR family winged helix-turn-helix transcriptional regulator n=1 Tax=Maritimibacter alkaliphilus TaxID=404236 RepID=UPI001C9426DB|nr:MarR family winged helix-turn-helix transcriptional regulator [Maritimibacter alkaliphilus]MBY6089032.1 MarR family winged helix-turn-helix transcriptional regulator [Maritimibacter alkaliphilus]
MKRFLSEAGISPEVTDRALAIDAIVQRWRRQVQKRELGRMALRELGLELDLPKMDVLFAIAGPRNEFGHEAGQETMVSTVATRLNIDPSRASRLVSEVISLGYAERGVSQQDARRTIVALTPKGRAIVDAVRTIKFLIMGQFLTGWSQEEIDTFLPLMDRFFAWVDDSGDASAERLHPEIEALARDLARKLK